MAKYHVNPETGKPGKCTATARCPFGSEEVHYGSTVEARKGYENLMEAKELYSTEEIYPHSLTLTPLVERTLETLEDIGLPLIVGGAVRDSFRQADNKDIDIEVHRVSMDELVAHLKSNGYKVDEVGKQFGVLKIYSPAFPKEELDVAIPRRENQVGAGHRGFEVETDSNMTVEEAAERRDFTFNAMMYDHRRGVLVDPAGGKEDLQQGVMRHVSDKFAEDPLRVLRGFQFASRFSMELAPETSQMAKSLRDSYHTLSSERVQEEWEKYFRKSVDPLKGVKALEDSGWNDTEPGLSESLKNPRALASLEGLPHASAQDRVVFGAAAIGENMDARQGDSFIKKMVNSKDEQIRSLDLKNADLSAMETRKDRKLYALKTAGRGFKFETFERYAELTGNTKAAEIARQAKAEGLSHGAEPDLVMGRDLLTFTDRKPGPWMGSFLNEIRNKQYEDAFANKDEAIAWAKANIEA